MNVLSKESLLARLSWCTLLISALGRQKQVELCEFNTSQDYTVRLQIFKFWSMSTNLKIKHPLFKNLKSKFQSIPNLTILEWGMHVPCTGQVKEVTLQLEKLKGNSKKARAGIVEGRGERMKKKRELHR